MTEQEILIAPTIIVRVEPGRVGVVTAGEGEDKALIVFRSLEDARAYQEHTGKHTGAEGFKVVGVLEEGALAAILETQGLRYVVMPEAWTGTGDVDSFTAANFLRLLEKSPRV